MKRRTGRRDDEVDEDGEGVGKGNGEGWGKVRTARRWMMRRRMVMRVSFGSIVCMIRCMGKLILKTSTQQHHRWRCQLFLNNCCFFGVDVVRNRAFFVYMLHIWDVV